MSGVPPRDAPERSPRHATSLFILNTGDGKGKSTAAFGMVLRALARNWCVAVVQFVKSGEWRTGEEAMCRTLGVDWWSTGDGFTWDSENIDETEAVARAGWEHARATIAAGAHELVVLDEVTYPIAWGWIALDDVARTIRERPPIVNVVATGRDAPKALLELADTATEMVNLHHAFDAGIGARRGIDY
ncbi:MAG: cob(I)yrinic acid a,c-diamide adenosyltransferase [Actinomycetota bacterium]